MEAELGLRPARQLSAWLDLATYQKMIRRADLAQRIRATRTDGPAAAPKALGARACRLGQEVYEASATVQLPDRARAMALRIEKHRNRWKVTALELG
ncbi:Rv3235 family protein [Citricoccus parietis]|uniref:Rv3235 family protein n=1 Tax=Citricoccus parietis TaxID=592307 RepID=A0ABV5FWF5_9MICC